MIMVELGIVVPCKPLKLQYKVSSWGTPLQVPYQWLISNQNTKHLLHVFDSRFKPVYLLMNLKSPKILDSTITGLNFKNIYIIVMS